MMKCACAYQFLVEGSPIFLLGRYAYLYSLGEASMFAHGVEGSFLFLRVSDALGDEKMNEPLAVDRGMKPLSWGNGLLPG